MRDRMDRQDEKLANLQNDQFDDGNSSRWNRRNHGGSEDEDSGRENRGETEEEYTVEGETLITRHVLNSQVKADDMEQQRENIFHTRCLINNKVCSMIIDAGSYTNVASTTLVEKLNLSTLIWLFLVFHSFSFNKLWWRLHYSSKKEIIFGQPPRRDPSCDNP